MIDLKNLIPFGRNKAVKGNPRTEDPSVQMQREMIRLFESLFRDIERSSERRGHFTPPINAAESAKEIRITAELPGMDEKDLDISITGDNLTIRGEKNVERSGGHFHSERISGSFIRTVALPREVEPDRVQAHIKRGILTVVLPKTEQVLQETRKIPVRTE